MRMAIVTTLDRREVKRVAGRRVASVFGHIPAGGRWGFVIELPLTAMSPGSYTLTVEAVSARRANPPVRRRIPFVVEEPPRS